MKKYFLDTGYLIALETADDQYHQKALDHWEPLRESLPLLITTTYVFDEAVTFFNSRKQHAKAVEVGNLLLESPSVKMVHIDQALFQGAWRYFIQHKDKSYSFTDCLSFIVMKRFRIQKAMTFDKHFIQAGFEKEPQ